MKSTQRRSSWAEFLGRMAEHRISPRHTSHIHISPHHTSQAESTKKYEFCCENSLRTIPDQRKARELPPKMNIQEVEDPKGRKSTSFIMKTRLRTIRDQRKVRELPRKMKTEEVEEPKKHENYRATPVSGLSRPSQNTEKYENYHEKSTSKKLKSRKLRKFTCKTRRRRSPPPEKYEDYQEKCTRKHETTKIARNPGLLPLP